MPLEIPTTRWVCIGFAAIVPKQGNEFTVVTILYECATVPFPTERDGGNIRVVIEAQTKWRLMPGLWNGGHPRGVLSAKKEALFVLSRIFEPYAEVV
jgi:hypothetical protein